MIWRSRRREVEAALREAEQAKRERLAAEDRRRTAQKRAEESMATVQELRDQHSQNGFTKMIFGIAGRAH